LAEADLAAIWLRTTDRQAVTEAAYLIDQLRSRDPLSQGEEFYGDRLLVALPLAVTYSVNEPDRTVQILQVWHR
jgi:hypothetical protein